MGVGFEVGGGFVDLFGYRAGQVALVVAGYGERFDVAGVEFGPPGGEPGGWAALSAAFRRS